MDVISRREAIEQLHQSYNLLDAERRLEDMPSAQPGTCDDPRADVYYLAEKIGIHRLYALVVELRGEPEPCKDAVSRQAAIDALMEILDRPNHAEFLYTDEICKTLNELPSAQPERKTGRLIHESAYNWYRCSVCKKVYSEALLKNFNECMYQPCFRYCPNCGARMEDGGE